MCFPILGAAVGIAGSVVSAMGAAQQATAQAQMDRYNEAAEKVNAQQTALVGAKEQENIGVKYDRLEGEQVTKLAKGGIDPYYGSALTVLGDTWQAEAHDKNVKYIETESKRFAHLNRATAYGISAENHAKAAKVAAAGSFLSGLGGALNSLNKGSGAGGSLLING